MIKLYCKNCGKAFYTYPSRLHFSQYCSRECYSHVRNKQLVENGKKFRYKKGDIPFSKIHPEVMPRGENNYNWKGEKVSYRGLHYWLRRVKGIPIVCSQCGFKRTTPKSIHWANVDGKYKRNPDDYIALCTSCHKLYDLNL